MSSKSLNTQYLLYLSKYPLLTKSITAGTLAGLNEILASILAKDYKYSQVASYKIKHVLSPKIFTMMIYGALIVTPISHQMYGILNRVFKGPLSSRMKIAQVLTSLTTITPTLAAVFVSWLSLINNYKPPKDKFDIKQELCNVMSIIKKGLKANYLPILKTSVITSCCTLIIAQKFLKPELWVIFFNLVYFILGTIQNTKVKKAQKVIKKDD